ncbi:hypothetical protein [Rhodococcus sp. BE178]|uniref:hypothetical protein n=1 Tax=Rhodococcus sp. BE178 TaxID=2817737 RepID=UPI003D2224B7
MPRIPSDAEITAAARELGIEGPIRGAQRSKVAKAILLAEAMPDDEPGEPGRFVDQITSTHARLIEAGLNTSAADRVVAAIAPAVWRDTN